MFVPRNTVILFDEKLTQEFIHLSEEINRKVPSDIILNTQGTYPHATIYTTNYPMENEEKVVERLKEIAKSLSSFSMYFDKPVVDMLGVWINSEMTNEVRNIHEKIVDGLNDLRNGLYDEGELVAIGDDKKRQESLKKYGMWAAKELYIPHVTLSRPKDSARLEEALKLLPGKIGYTAHIKEIAYVERGRFGTCKKILQKFPLG